MIACRGAENLIWVLVCSWFFLTVGLENSMWKNLLILSVDPTPTLSFTEKVQTQYSKLHN